jgi:hypothetical protein
MKKEVSLPHPVEANDEETNSKVRKYCKINDSQ